MENRNTEHREKIAEFMLTPNNERAQINFYKKNVITDLSSDFTLPDYLPEIRKMLGIKAKISPISRYIGAGNVSFSGRVDYDMIYLSAEGKLASVPLGDDFSFEVQPEIPENIEWDTSNDAFADVETDMLHCRVTAPRKVNIKCRLRSLVRLFGYDEIGETLRELGANTEKLTTEKKCAMVHRYMSEVIELGDEISIIGTSENVIPLSLDASVNILETNVNENNLNCRGEVIARIVYENSDNGETTSTTRKMPFSQNVEIDSDGNKNSPVFCNVRGTCGEIKVSSGESKLLIDTEVILEADTIRNIPVTITEDLFVPCCESSVQYRDFKFDTVEKCTMGTMTVTQTIPLSNLSMSQESEIIDHSCYARSENISERDQNIYIDGNAKIWILSKEGDEFSSGETVIPFSFNTGTSTADGKLSYSAKPTVTACHFRIEGENLLCEIDISLPYCIMREQSARIAEEASVSKESFSSLGGITIYYPEKGETLWDIAKKFSVPMRKLAEANDLPSVSAHEDISSKHYIMIY
ncbi:MAG: DUF3794 domain-containing protein [Clostridia bacterium]|nr:DUF3794 domain-containing protein [Clostridia bacterium]